MNLSRECFWLFPGVLKLIVLQVREMPESGIKIVFDGKGRHRHVKKLVSLVAEGSLRLLRWMVCALCFM